MSTKIIFLSLCLAALCAPQAKAQIIVSDGTKVVNDTIGEAQLLVQYETRCIPNPEKPGKGDGRNHDAGNRQKPFQILQLHQVCMRFRAGSGFCQQSLAGNHQRTHETIRRKQTERAYLQRISFGKSNNPR